jgi:hypothetical protein
VIFFGPGAVKPGLMATGRPFNPRNTGRLSEPPVKDSNSRNNRTGHAANEGAAATNTLLPCRNWQFFRLSKVNSNALPSASKRKFRQSRPEASS